MRAVIVGLLRAYRFAISPLYGQVCRYHPSCSAYALEAVETHGAARGSWLAVRRIGRCHPWAAGGIDHVPGSAGERRYLQTERETDGPAAAPVAATVVAATRQGV